MVAQSWEYPIDWYNTNLISTVEIIENLRNIKNLNKYIHFTTPEVYVPQINGLKKIIIFYQIPLMRFQEHQWIFIY